MKTRGGSFAGTLERRTHQSTNENLLNFYIDFRAEFGFRMRKFGEHSSLVIAVRELELDLQNVATYRPLELYGDRVDYLPTCAAPWPLLLQG